MAIAKLSPLLVNQIAAGEVIERPASVVKELVENSVDAGATQVDVQVEDGGRQLIRVRDDGGGITPEDLPLAVAPHATSKLTKAEQLAAIGTLGFRGEALASIASVSRLTIVTRPAQDSDGGGWTISASGDEVSPVAPAAASPGTVIEVRDLFFNTPARRKFLRGAPTEFGHVGETLSRIAMVHPHIGFTLRHDDRLTLELEPAASRRQRCLALIGKEMEDALLEFEQDMPGGEGMKPMRVWGLAAMPSEARATSRHQYICVNGRSVRDRNLTHAVREAYRGLMPPDRQPVVVVLLDLDPHAVDVNVHPTKAEVRFRDPSRVHSLVLHAIRQRLLGADLTPTVTPMAGAAPSLSWRPTDDELDEPAASRALPSADPRTFVESFHQMPAQQKGFIFEEVKRAMAAAATGDGPPPPPPAWEQAQQRREADVLQVHQSYLVTQDEQGIVIIDQHALHERVMFEELRRRMLSKQLESQRLLMPATVKADARRMGALDSITALLQKLGIDAQPMGPATIAVHAFPTLLFDRHVDPVDFLEEVLDRAADGELDTTQESAEEAALHRVLDMMACKAAVKAGDHLTDEELTALLARREEIDRGSSCPHGRPTSIRLTLRDLEKHFKRV